MKKLLPPFTVIILISLMILIKKKIVLYHFLDESLTVIGIIPILLGLLFILPNVVKFLKIKTELNTFKEPKHLVTNGFFKITRNPIYLGFLLILIGTWLILGSLLPFVGVLIFFLLANYWYIPFEENNLIKIFGLQYKEYKRKVRRWI